MWSANQMESKSTFKILFIHHINQNILVKKNTYQVTEKIKPKKMKKWKTKKGQL